MLRTYILSLSLIFILSGIAALSFAQQTSLTYLPDENGALRHWLLLGPFLNSQSEKSKISEHGTACYGYHTDLLIGSGGETAVAPYAGQIMQPSYRWELLFNPSEWIDLNSHYEKNDDVVAYAYLILNAEEMMPVKLGLSHNDGLKIFLNGSQVYEEHMAHVVLNAVSLIVTLEKGDNRLLIKVDEKTGGWGFGLSVKTIHDKKVKGSD